MRLPSSCQRVVQVGGNECAQPTSLISLGLWILNGLPGTMKKARCRCYINATYNTKTAFRTGKLPKPCPVHEKELYDEWVIFQSLSEDEKLAFLLLPFPRIGGDNEI